MTGSPLIFRNQSTSLGEIPFHLDQAGIQRLAPQDFPVHTAIHQVSRLEPLTERYVAIHQHPVPEINLFIPTDAHFAYELQLGDETHVIKGHSTVWIPAGMPHAANLIQGTGFYVCVILAASETIAWSE